MPVSFQQTNHFYNHAVSFFQLKERNSMAIEVIGLLEGDGHCVAERKKQHGYRSDWSVGRRWALCS